MNPISIGAYGVVLLLYVTLVYVAPWQVDQEIFGSFDSHGYAFRLLTDADQVREDQPFLRIYYSGLPSPAIAHYFAAALHTLLISPLFFCVRSSKYDDLRRALFAVVLFPEVLIFLATVSKEGLAVIGALSVALSICFYSDNRKLAGILLLLYGGFLFEISRPGFSLIPGVAFMAAVVLPVSGANNRIRNVGLFLLISVIFATAVIYGPGANIVIEIYERGRDYLLWFEENMGSESFLKSAARNFFAMPFASNTPGFATALFVVIASVLKAFVYAFALPVLSLPRFENPVAQVWAMVWQISASISSLFLGLIFFFGAKSRLNRGLAWCRGSSFGVYFMYLIAASTFIFHVRYRAPAISVLLFFIFLYRPIKLELLLIINLIIIAFAASVTVYYARLI